MSKSMKVTSLDVLSCEGGWRTLNFQKIQTDAGITGYAECNCMRSAPMLKAGIDAALLEELQTRYTMVARDGQLVAVHPRHSDDNLTPVEPDHFAGSHWWFASCALLAMKVDGWTASASAVDESAISASSGNDPHSSMNWDYIRVTPS